LGFYVLDAATDWFLAQLLRRNRDIGRGVVRKSIHLRDRVSDATRQRLDRLKIGSRECIGLRTINAENAQLLFRSLEHRDKQNRGSAQAAAKRCIEFTAVIGITTQLRRSRAQATIHHSWVALQISDKLSAVRSLHRAVNHPAIAQQTDEGAGRTRGNARLAGDLLQRQIERWVCSHYLVGWRRKSRATGLRVVALGACRESIRLNC
jgi:hypothetical protein